jgi:ankyrin repeat protein
MSQIFGWLQKGNTALHCAVKRVDRAEDMRFMVQLLLDNGADPNVRNSAKESCIELAAPATQDGIVEMLVQAPKRKPFMTQHCPGV